MSALEQFYNWWVSLLKNGGYLVSWLLTPMDFGFVKITPLMFFAIDGLIVFLSVAIAKWIIA